MNRQILVAVACLGLATSAKGQQNQSAMDAQWAAVEKQRATIRESMSSSLEKQVASVRKQIGVAAENEKFFIMPSSLPPRAAYDGDCEALSPLSVQGLAQKAARNYRVNPDLVMAVIRQESSFRPCAVSGKGALGLMQLMPATAADLGVQDTFDPEQNITGGTKLLRDLMDRYAGDLNRVLGAYNAGPGAVDTYDGVPPFTETESYVDTIMKALDSSRREH